MRTLPAVFSDRPRTCYQRAMNTTATTISIVLRHIIPALQSIQRELVEAEKQSAAPHEPKREPAPREGSSKRFYQVSEAAAFLNVSESLIRKLLMTKRIPHFKIGRRVMFSEEQLLGWVAGFEYLAEEPSPRGTRRN